MEYSTSKIDGKEDLLPLLERAVELFQRDGVTEDNAREKYAEAMNLLGEIYAEKEKVDKAISTLEKAQELFKKLELPMGQASVLNNLGLAYEVGGNLKDSYKYYEESSVICKRENDKSGEAISVGNIGLILVKMGEPVRALDALRRSERLYDTAGVSTQDSSRMKVRNAISKLEKGEE